jgi:hypothetical protein
MTPELHIKLLVSLSDFTDHVMERSDAAPGAVRSSPDDADLAGSIDCLDRLRSLVETLGGALGRSNSREQNVEDETLKWHEVEKTLAEFQDGVVGRSFVAQAWPIAEAWLRNKESRRFRIKYGEAILELRGPDDAEKALALMKDAVAAPRPKRKKPARRPKAKAKAPRAKARKTKKASPPKKSRKKAAAKKRAPAKARKPARRRR